MLKNLILGTLFASAGYFIGVYFTAKEFESSYNLSVATKVIKESSILEYLEAGNVDAAKRIQAKFLESSLQELSFIQTPLPKEVSEIVNKRKVLAMPK
jgi:hypothetical protein